MPRYFTGRSVSSQTLTQADAKDFATLVKTLIALPVVLHVTEAEYRAMPENERKKAKLTSYLTACTFPESPWEGRKNEHATECNLIFLDIDDADQARMFIDNPRLLKERLNGFSYAAYRTISSTPENPRMRLMVSAKGIPPARYADAVRTIAGMIGIPFVTGESIKVSQPMFRPSIFADQDESLDHPLFSTRYDGEDFTEADIAAEGTELPGVKNGSRTSSTIVKAGGDIADDFLMYYRQPVRQITPEVAREALKHIPSACSRPEWVEIALALKHQFPADDGVGAGLFSEWSVGAANYVSDQDCRVNFKAAQEAPRGRAPVTIRTLLKRALVGGWDSNPVKEECYADVANWLQYDAASQTQLMSEGVRRIALTPLLSNVEEDSLLRMIVMCLKEKHEVVVSTSALAKDLKRQKALLSNPQVPGEHEEPEVPGWAQYIAYVGEDESFYHQPTGRKHTKTAFDDIYGRRLLPTAEELLKREKEVNQQTLNTPIFVPSDYLLNHLKCPVADDYHYDPGNPEQTIITKNNRPYINTYRRTYPKPDRGRLFEAWELVDEHLRNIIAEPWHRQRIMDFLAYMVQAPGKKIRWAVLLQGAEGCGKSLFTSIMNDILGVENVNIIAKSSADRGYNDWVVGYQAVIVEEIRVSGANRHEIFDALKPMISDTLVPITQKYRDSRKIEHCANFWLNTNHHDALPANENSRRIFYLKSSIQHREQVMAMRAKPGYFSTLFGMCRDNAAGLRAMFEEHKISDDFDPDGPAPVTEFLTELAHNTANDIAAAITRIVEDDDHAFICREVIAQEALFPALQGEHIGRLPSPQYLATVLQDAGYARLPDRVMLDGAKKTLWFRRECFVDGSDPISFAKKRLALKSRTDDESL